MSTNPSMSTDRQGRALLAWLRQSWSQQKLLHLELSLGVEIPSWSAKVTWEVPLYTSF
jgi:hypothetical protein